MGRGNPRAVTGTHTTPVGDELMVHVVGTAETHLLSPTTASVWERCDGRAGRAELEVVFADQPAELRPELVQLALDQLEKAGLVEDGGRSSDLARESRRRFLRKAMVGAAIVPTVMTVTMQPAAAAHSPGNTTGCGSNHTICGSTAPHCVNGSCVQCRDNGDCSGTKPICTNGGCVACSNDTQCGTGSYCCQNGVGCSTGECKAKQTSGACSRTSQCATGYCCKSNGVNKGFCATTESAGQCAA